MPALPEVMNDITDDRVHNPGYTEPAHPTTDAAKTNDPDLLLQY
jgi:hypothetical protein